MCWGFRHIFLYFNAGGLFSNRMFIDEILKFFLVAVGYGYVILVEDDSSSLYNLYLALLYDERTMYPDKPVGWQRFFHRLHAYQGDDGFLLIFQMYLDIIFQPFYIQYPVQINLYEFIVTFHINVLGGHGRGHHGCLASPFHLKPMDGFVYRLHEIRIADGFQQIVQRHLRMCLSMGRKG